MNLGLTGKRALVCASSQGLGLACATSLAREGVAVVINGRDAAKLEKAAEGIRSATAADVAFVVSDLNEEKGRDALLAACPDPDILINNNGGPPPGKLADWDRQAWLGALETNLIAPAMFIRAVMPGMQERGFGRIVNITSAMVKTPRGPMGLSAAARTGLTALCKALSAEAAAHNVTINNLLPERIDTERQIYMGHKLAEMKGITFEQEREFQKQSIAAKRLGLPQEFGDACAFLCGANAGFISGQNLQLDGGSYQGLI